MYVELYILFLYPDYILGILTCDQEIIVDDVGFIPVSISVSAISIDLLGRP